MLRRFAATAFLDIELKVAGLEQATLSALRAKPPQRGYFVSSFLPEVVVGMRRLDDTVPLGLICSTPPQFGLWPTLPVSALFLHWELVSREVVDQLQAAGKQVFAWTINDAERMRDLVGMGAEGIISDDTQLLTQVLAGSQLR